MLRYWLGCFFILSSAISAIGVQLPYYRVRATWLAPTSSPVVKDVHTKLLNANGRVISISQTSAGISDIIALGPEPSPRIHRYSRFEKTFSQHEIISPAAGVATSPNHGSLTSSEFPETRSLRTLKPLTEPLHNQSVIAPPADSPMPLGDTVPPSGLSPPPSHTSDCCKANSIPRHVGSQCDCVYPIKMELLLLNVSFTSNPNWSAQVEQQLAFQLGLQVSQINIVNFYVVGVTGLNITMDFAPLKGTGFSKVDAHRINYTIVMHKVHIDPSLAGEYKLLNLTWFVPPAISPESAAPAPANAPAATPSSVATETNSNNSRRQSLTLIIGIGAGVVIVIILSISIIVSCLFKQGKKQPPLKETVKPRNVDAVSAENSFPRPTSTRCFAFEELKEATNNFESASVLGEGGFGRVFKGVLSDGTAVAIKKLTSGGHQGDKEFLVEIEMLSRLHHRNLVKLIGYYSNRETSQHLLCYELVPNGSLESWLHGPNGASTPLSWESRMKIALDAARGLAYLHEDSQPCVIHRDFKASNILLENNFHAKVSDFGLAKQAPEGGRNHLSTRVMGTFGYVAPEYAMTGHLLVKSDVYSYGVVLLELLTGKRPVEMSQPSGQENLVTWARPILRDNNRLEELADSKLGGNYPKEDFVRVCMIAAACVAPEANQRPTMGEVVQSLKMVQRITEYQDTTTKSTCISRPNVRQSSTTYESDGTSSMFSSGPFSGISMIDNENTLRTAVFSEDLQEGR